MIRTMSNPLEEKSGGITMIKATKEELKSLYQGKIEHLSKEQVKKMKRKNLEKILNEPVVRDALKKLSKE